MPPEIVFLLKLIRTSIRKIVLLPFKYLNFISLPSRPPLGDVQVVTLIGIQHTDSLSQRTIQTRGY